MLWVNVGKKMSLPRVTNEKEDIYIYTYLYHLGSGSMASRPPTPPMDVLGLSDAPRNSTTFWEGLSRRSPSTDSLRWKKKTWKSKQFLTSNSWVFGMIRSGRVWIHPDSYHSGQAVWSTWTSWVFWWWFFCHVEEYSNKKKNKLWG